MVEVAKFKVELNALEKALAAAKSVLLTAPAAADGDSIGGQLALRRMLLQKYPNLNVRVINDEPLPPRYLFLPDVEFVETPETFSLAGDHGRFDVAIQVDGGIDRAGRLREVYERCPTTVFIDHHLVSYEYPYTIRLVEPTASSTTELIYHISQTPSFATPLDSVFCQHIYFGLIFDTGFFRHSNTTPEVMELAAKLLRTGFDFTRLGERGMLERSFGSLQLLAHTLAHAERRAEGKVLWSQIGQESLRRFHAVDDDREGIIDQLLLTTGTEVAVLFFELRDQRTKLSLRSHGQHDVAHFARSLTEHGGGHQKAAGALLEMPIGQAVPFVLKRLEELVARKVGAR